MRRARPDRDQVALLGDSPLPKGVTWSVHAASVINRVAQTRREFTTDDLWIAGLIRHPKDNRAIGKAMLQASRDGVCERTDRTVTTKQLSRHRGDVRVWRSLVFRAP